MKQWIVLASVALVGAVILLALTTAVVIRVHRVFKSGSLASAPIAAPRASVSALPPKRCFPKAATQDAVLARAHARGEESEQLRSVIDEQFASVTTACHGPRCAELRQQVLSPGAQRATVRRAERATLLSLPQSPDLRIENDPRVVRRLEFYTQNTTGRASFEKMLLRCAAFKDSIASTLTQHGVPASLLAVVFASSGCAPLSKSALGAEGIWQLTPAVARIYGLNIIDSVVDERHSPQKSTEAAAKYLRDLFQKFADWDLALLAYGMGPLAVLTRLDNDCDERLGFWDLVDAQVLADGDVDHVPNVQAIALVLVNLEHFRFQGASPLPRITVAQRVPPNTRLSLVARAARTSLDELRRLNLDLKQLTTPDLANFTLRVPKRDTAQTERTLLDLIAARDDSDLCVSNAFDWGRDSFTPQMAKRCPSWGVRESDGDTEHR